MRLEKYFAFYGGLTEVLRHLSLAQNIFGILVVAINVAIEAYVIYGISHKEFGTSIVVYLLILRLASAFILSTFISVTACNICTRIRNVTLEEKWMRNKPNTGELSSSLLMLYDHLVQFYFVARLRVIYDVLYVSIIIGFFVLVYDIALTFYVIVIALSGLVILLMFHRMTSNVSRKMSKLETELVTVGGLINERGFAGWSNSAMTGLLDIFARISQKLNKYYILRLSSSNTIRMFLEVGVFGIVAAGMLDFSKSDYGNNLQISSSALLLLFSRLAPVCFGILTLASTLGYGQMAKHVYVRKNELG